MIGVAIAFTVFWVVSVAIAGSAAYGTGVEDTERRWSEAVKRADDARERANP